MLLFVCALMAANLDDDERFITAVARFRKLEYEAALAEFETLASESRPDKDRATLLLWSGASRALLGDDGAARLAFESALRLDPSATLYFKTSPKVIELFDEVQKRMPPPAPPPPPVVEEKPPPAAAPAAAPVVEPVVEPSSSSGFWILAATSGVLGAAAGATAGVFGFDAVSKIQIAESPETSQQDAVALEDDINTSLWLAGALGGATVALATTSIIGVVIAIE